MQGVDMSFINRKDIRNIPSTIESLKLCGSSLEMLKIDDFGLNIQHFTNLQVIDFTIDDEVSPNGFSENLIQ